MTSLDNNNPSAPHIDNNDNINLNNDNNNIDNNNNLRNSKMLDIDDYYNTSNNKATPRTSTDSLDPKTFDELAYDPEQADDAKEDGGHEEDYAVLDFIVPKTDDPNTPAFT